MKIAPVAEVKARFSAYLEAAKEGPIVVTKNGRPVALLVSAETDEAVEDLLLAHSPRLARILGESRRQIDEGGALSHDEFWGRAATPDHGAPARLTSRPSSRSRGRGRP